MRKFGLLLLLLPLFSPLMANAALITEEDRSAFLAANPTALLEDFNSITTDQSFRNSTVTVNNLSFSASGPRPLGAFAYRIDARPLIRTTVNQINGSTQVAFGLTLGNTNTISFSRPVTAFGADFGGLGTGLEPTIISAGGDSIAISSLNPGFFGFNSATPFSSISFTSDSSPTVILFSLDNALYAPVPAPIPIPAALPLLLAGLGSLAALRRRKRAT